MHVWKPPRPPGQKGTQNRLSVTPRVGVIRMGERTRPTARLEFCDPRPLTRAMGARSSVPEVSASSSAVILPRVSEAREAAFYYPGVIWRDAGWVKSLALFFDEVALLVPDYMRDRPHFLDPAIAGGLQEAGLLRILSPETLVDRNATERLATAMAGALTEGALDALPDAGPFQELCLLYTSPSPRD